MTNPSAGGRDKTKLDVKSKDLEKIKEGLFNAIEGELAGLKTEIDMTKLKSYIQAQRADVAEQKYVENKNTGTKILKDKNDKHAKIKLTKNKLKIKEDGEVILKVDLKNDEVKINKKFNLEVQTADAVHSFERGQDKPARLSDYVAKNGKENEVESYKLAGLSNADLGVNLNSETGEITFDKNAPVGTYEIKWQAVTKDGKELEVRTLTVEVKAKNPSPEDVDPNNNLPEVVFDFTERDHEEFVASLDNLKDAVSSLPEPIVNLELGQNNLISLAEKIAYARQLLETTKNLANNSEDFEVVKKLEEFIEEQENALEDAKKVIEVKKTKIEELMNKEKDRILQEQEKQKEDFEEKFEKIKQEQERELAKFVNKAQDAEKAFENIKAGRLDIEDGTSFQAENLRSVEGVSFEAKKHSLAVARFIREKEQLDFGMQAMQDKFNKYDEEKGLLAGKIMGGIGAAGIGGLALGATFGLVSAPLTLTVAGVAGLAFGVKNLISAASRRLGDPKKATALKNGSIIGWLTGENVEAKRMQEEKIKFEENYDQYSNKLQEKAVRLALDSKKIAEAARNAENLSDKEAIKKTIGDGMREKLQNMYKGLGMKINGDLIEEKIAETQQGIDAFNAQKVQELKNSEEIIVLNGEDGALNQVSQEMEQTEINLDGLNYQAADIGDYTFGALGKWLNKGGEWCHEKIIPVAGGVAKFFGNLSLGIGTMISEPNEFLNGVVGMIGMDFSRNNDDLKWYNPLTYFEEGKFTGTWGSIITGILAAESWGKVYEVYKSGAPLYEVLSVSSNALVESVGNLFLLFYGLGGGSAANGTGVMARTLGKIGKNGGRMSRVMNRVGHGMDKTVMRPFSKLGRKTMLKNWKQRAVNVKNLPKNVWNGTAGRLSGRLRIRSKAGLKTIAEADIKVLSRGTTNGSIEIAGKTFKVGDKIQFLDETGKVVEYTLEKVNPKTFWLSDGKASHIIDMKSGVLQKSKNLATSSEAPKVGFKSKAKNYLKDKFKNKKSKPRKKSKRAKEKTKTKVSVEKLTVLEEKLLFDLGEKLKKIKDIKKTIKNKGKGRKLPLIGKNRLEKIAELKNEVRNAIKEAKSKGLNEEKFVNKLKYENPGKVDLIDDILSKNKKVAKSAKKNAKRLKDKKKKKTSNEKVDGKKGKNKGKEKNKQTNGNTEIVAGEVVDDIKLISEKEGLKLKMIKENSHWELEIGQQLKYAVLKGGNYTKVVVSRIERLQKSFKVSMKAGNKTFEFTPKKLADFFNNERLLLPNL